MAARNRTSLSGSNHRRIEESASRHPRRILTLAEVRILDERIAAQGREIEAILLENRRLAASHVACKRDVAAAQQEVRRLSDTASSTNAETDAQVREVHERFLKSDAEARSIDIDGLSKELDRVRAEIKQHRDERAELTDKLNDIESDILRSQPELQEFSELKAEIEAWQKEIRRGRAAIEYERKMCSSNIELSEAMEKHKNTIAGEAEKLRSELANAERRAMTAVVDPVLSANQGPGYAIHQPGYGGNSLSNSHAVHQVAVPVANQGPGYAVHQPGYGGNSLSDPNVVHQVTLPVANQGPGYAINQPEYNGNPLPDPHVVHQVTLPVPNQGPGYAFNQPEHNGNPLADPHVVPQGKSLKKNGEQRPNKKGKDKLGNNEANAQGKKLKCQKCKKRHVGECLFGKKVCFKCKQPGHIARDCASIKKEKLEKEGKAQGFAST